MEVDMANTDEIFNSAIDHIISEPVEYMDYVKFLSRGNIFNFSMQSTILIFAQRENSEYVAFYDDWKKSAEYLRSILQFI